jgi:hypothetical protein
MALEDHMMRGRIRLDGSDEQVLAIDHGRVVCPHRGMIDLELCFLCLRFRGFQEGITEGLVCSHEAVLGIPDLDLDLDLETHALAESGRPVR